MARKSRARPYTPPPDLKHTGEGHIETPARSGLIALKLAEQLTGTPISCEIKQVITGITSRSQSRVLQSHQVRRLHNIPDSGADPRGHISGITRDDTAAIASYVDDPSTSMRAKGLPWGDIAFAAGVTLPQTAHQAPLGKRQIDEMSIRRRCEEDEDIINAVAEEERELTKAQAKAREEWRVEQQEERPCLEDWFNTVHCNEFHVGIGTQTTNRIKRKRGKEHRYASHNVHRKKISSKAKAWEDAHLKLFNVFVLVGYNYRKIIPYDVGNTNDKMNSKCYTEWILPRSLTSFELKALFLSTTLIQHILRRY